MAMPTVRSSRGLGALALGAALALAVSGPAVAQGQSTPIQSPQDAACRNEARARVFTAPDPQGLGLYAVGRQIYMACMQRAKAGSGRRAPRIRTTAE